MITRSVLMRENQYIEIPDCYELLDIRSELEILFRKLKPLYGYEEESENIIQIDEI